MREQICTHLQSDSNYKNIFNAKLLKEILPDFIKNYNQYDVKDKAGKLETLALFNGFSTYFTDFFEKRKNVFTKEAVSTSIAYRIVHENSLIFLANMTSYKKISEKALDEIEVIEKNNQDKMGDWELNQIFNPHFYNMVLIQSGIDFYNEICGVVNAHMNLYCQQTKNNYNLFKMRKLHKQILAYTSTSFEVPKMFEDDMSVYNAVNAFIDETEKVKLKQENEDKKICVGIIMIDNYEEVTQRVDAEQKTQLMAKVESTIYDWVNETNGILVKADRDTYVYVFEQKNLEKIKEEKFAILDSIKNLVRKDKIQLTLSIAISNEGDTERDVYKSASAAMDVILGRGGDQAVIRQNGKYLFFGGKVEEVEKRTKVKARIVAHALEELIKENDKIIEIETDKENIDI